jgi:hypothetical protein
MFTILRARFLVRSPVFAIPGCYKRFGLVNFYVHWKEATQSLGYSSPQYRKKRLFICYRKHLDDIWLGHACSTRRFAVVDKSLRNSRRVGKPTATTVTHPSFRRSVVPLHCHCIRNICVELSRFARHYKISKCLEGSIQGPRCLDSDED